MSLVKKLHMKPDMRVGVLSAPEGYPEALGELPSGFTLVTHAGGDGEDAEQGARGGVTGTGDGEQGAGGAGAGASGAGRGSLDMVLLFVRSLAELEARAPQAIELGKYDALLWIVYPKKSSKIKTDINRDTGWAKMLEFGHTGVAMVALDDTWSAMRFRPKERVGK